MTPDLVVYIVIGVVGLTLLVLIWPLVNLYIQAKFSNAPIPFAQIVRMRLAGVDPMTVVITHIRMVKGTSHQIPVPELVNHYLAGGRLPLVVNALITAEVGKFDLTWEETCIADLEGRDVLEEAQQRLHQIRRERGEID
jgi:uncharacterized protein YqfA (UPF0365 family)